MTIFYLYEPAKRSPLFLLHKWKEEELCIYVNYDSAAKMVSLRRPGKSLRDQRQTRLPEVGVVSNRFPVAKRGNTVESMRMVRARRLE